MAGSVSLLKIFRSMQNEDKEGREKEERPGDDRFLLDGSSA